MTIGRYTTDAMRSIWSDQNKFDTWRTIELAVCESFLQEGLISQGEWSRISEARHITAEEVYAREKITRHDVVAFVQLMQESVDDDAARWIHHGLTSSDIVDTSLSVLMANSVVALSRSLATLSIALGELRWEHGDAECVGRTHGIHAEPMTFGHKIDGWLSSLGRVETPLYNREMYGKLSGAVGTYSGSIDRRVEAAAMSRLGLIPEKSATQVVGRDFHAQVVSDLAILSSVFERIAQEIRLLQRTEVREVMEGFAPGQQGSSVMPHKRNPMLSERVCGLSRIVRGYAASTLENVALWHERDLTHSSVERIAIPGAFSLVDYQATVLTSVIENLEVFPDRMLSNLDSTGGLVYSSEILQKLVADGMDREKAYSLVQSAANRVWDGETTMADEFPDLALNDLAW